MLFLVVAFLILLVTLAYLWTRHQSLRRESYIRSAKLPRGLFDRLRQKHPELSAKDCHLVALGLRQFFLAYLKSDRKFVAMPSQVVDDLWHEFILYTRHYDVFCRRAFGRFLHHTPAVVLSPGQRSNTGLRRCWWFACAEESINPRMPSRLPLLFALDAKLGIADGFRYVADCSSVRRDDGRGDGVSSHCGGDFSDASVDGGVDGFGDSAGDGGGSDGCGGGGCGGGGGD